MARLKKPPALDAGVTPERHTAEDLAPIFLECIKAWDEHGCKERGPITTIAKARARAPYLLRPHCPFFIAVRAPRAQDGAAIMNQAAFPYVTAFAIDRAVRATERDRGAFPDPAVIEK